MKILDEEGIESIVSSFIEIELEKPDDFLKVKESLTRMGIISFKSNTLHQSCNILHKRGKYYIVSFKELFLLDGKKSTLSDTDIARRNTIAKLLEDWGLLKIVSHKNMETFVPVSSIDIIPFRNKFDYELKSKYTIGK